MHKENNLYYALSNTMSHHRQHKDSQHDCCSAVKMPFGIALLPMDAQWWGCSWYCLPWECIQLTHYAYILQCTSMMCPAGMRQCPAGSLTPTTCAACEPGSYGNTQNKCEICPSGTYQPLSGATYCLSCSSLNMEVSPQFLNTIFYV